jgi:hypothetical protein
MSPPASLEISPGSSTLPLGAVTYKSDFLATWYYGPPCRTDWRAPQGKSVSVIGS